MPPILRYVYLVLFLCFSYAAKAQIFLEKFEQKAVITSFGDQYLLEYKSKKNVEVRTEQGEVILQINVQKEHPFIDKGRGVLYYGGSIQSFHNNWNYGQFYANRKKYDLQLNEEVTLPFLVHSFFSDIVPPIAVAADPSTRQVGIMGINGELIIPLQYDGIFPYDMEEGLLLVVQGENYFLIDAFNFNRLPSQYKLTEKMVTEKKLPVRFDTGVLNKSIIASLDGTKVGLYDYGEKKEKIPFRYKDFQLVGNEFLLAYGDTAMDIYDTNATLVLDQSAELTKLMEVGTWNNKTLLLFETVVKKQNMLINEQLLFKNENQPLSITLKPKEKQPFIGGLLNEETQFVYDVDQSKIVATFPHTGFELSNATYLNEDELWMEIMFAQNKKEVKVGFYNTRTNCLTIFDSSAKVEMITLDQSSDKAYYLVTEKVGLDYYTQVWFDCNQMITEPILSKDLKFNVQNKTLYLHRKTVKQATINGMPYGNKTEIELIQIFNKNGKELHD